MGYTILTEDECTIMIDGNNLRYGWQRRGTKKTSASSLSRQKKHLFGALYDGGLCVLFYDKQDSKTFLSFLRHLHKRYGRILVFVDNASWHKSAALVEGLKEFNGEVKIEYYLPYLPELNGVETQWNVIRNAIGNRVYASTSEMIRSIRKMIRNGVIFPVKMSTFLVP